MAVVLVLSTIRFHNSAYGTLGHAIEHGQVKGSHMTLNVQHESSFNYTKEQPCVMGRQHRPKYRLA